MDPNRLTQKSQEAHHHGHPDHDHDHIGAVFATRSDAEDAVGALRARGLGSERLGVAIHNDQPIKFERDASAAIVRDTEVGVAAGAPLGALAGIGLAALTATGAGAVIGVGGLLAMAGASSLMGGVLGGYLGVAAGFDDWDEHQQFGYVALQPGEVLVVVCSDDRPDVARTVMADAGGRIVDAESTSTS